MNSFCRLDHNLYGIYETIHVLNYFMDTVINVVPNADIFR